MKRIPHERGGSRIFDPPMEIQLSKYWSLNPPQKKKQPATESPSVSCMRLLNIFTCAERIGSLLS